MKRKYWKVKNFYLKEKDYYILNEIKKRNLNMSQLITDLLKEYLNKEDQNEKSK